MPAVGKHTAEAETAGVVLAVLTPADEQERRSAVR